ncbi:ABC transporter ATP-binding protein [Variovorax humicola]|uniref:ABC transporter ATP-binding protein n=1 Tax=Variovorax humicola TaxID=1769758 RepID=A0ABU8W7Q5_9BURK
MPASGQHPLRVLYAALWRFAADVRGQLVGALSLLGTSQLIRLGMPWLAGKAINALQQGEIGTATRWIALLVFVYLVSWGVHGPGRVLERNVAVRVREMLADTLYARIAAAPLTWHDAHHSGELQHRVHQAGRALSDFAQNQFVYLASAVTFVGPLIALMLLSRASGVLALLGYVLIGLVILRFDRALMKLARTENDADRRYVAALLDFIGNASTVIGLRLQAASRVLLRRRMAAVSVPLKRTAMLNEGKWATVELLGLGLTWALVLIYVWHERAPDQPVQLGNVFMIYQYAQQAAAVVGSMAANFQNFARMHTDYLSADPIWAAPGDPLDGRSDTPIEREAGWQRIAIHNLAWGYADATRGGGLHDMALALHRGERIALVGPSGGGKSTLLRVLAGLYLPQHGSLRIDGHVQDWATLRGLATLIPQEIEVFEASVRENLTFGTPCEEAALQAALHASAFDEVLAATKGSLDTPLTERGFNLSGGQRQRLCLARGVLAAQGSSLLLLDEPTSALDALTEARVLERIGAAFPDACMIASIHRLSVLDHFDTVVLMVAGRIADAGPRAEVLQRQPQLRHGTHK